MSKFRKLERGTCDELGCDLCHPDVKAKWSGKCAGVPDEFRNVWKFPVLNPVQVDAFELYAGEQTPSMTLCSGTGTGKTVGAEMGIMRQMELRENPHIVMLVPLKSLAAEKGVEWNEKFGDKLKILELTSDTKSASGRDLNELLKTMNVIITSYEMFNSWTRKPGIYSFLKDLDLLIVDEVHSIGNVSRGGELDGSLTRFMMLRNGNPAQHVNLSATFDNVIDLKQFFEQFVTRMNIIDIPFSPIVRHIEDVYVFDDFRGENENTLYNLIRKAHNANPEGGVLGLLYSRAGVEKVANELNAKHGANFARAHNAGMTRTVRMRVEEEFRNGDIKILVASPTIAMGVNLPGQSIVMICDFWDGAVKKKKVISKGDMQQIMGRAGRPPHFKEAFVLPAVSSKLENSYHKEVEKDMVVLGQVTKVLDSVINSEVSKAVECNVESLFEWLKKTFSFISTDIEIDDLKQMFTDELGWLVEKKFVILNGDGSLRATQKGIACSDMMHRPRFVQSALGIINSASFIESPSTHWADEDLVKMLADIYESDYSGVQVKDLVKDCEKLFSFDWILQRGRVNWKKSAPDFPVIREIRDDLSRLCATLSRCGIPRTSRQMEAMEYLNTSFMKGGIPLSMVKLSKALSKRGIAGVGNKRLFVLFSNGITAGSVLAGEVPDSLYLVQSARFGKYLNGFVGESKTYNGLEYVYNQNLWNEHRNIITK